MHTSFNDTLQATLKPWTALAKDFSATQSAHAKSASDLLTKPLDKASPEAFIELAAQASVSTVASAIKAMRLSMAQSRTALAALQAKAPAMPGPGVDLVKKFQDQATQAQEQFLEVMEKAVFRSEDVKPARKARAA